MGSPIATHVQQSLHDLQATFEVVEIDPDLADTAAFCEHYGYSPGASANAILVASRKPPGVHALCLALATTRLDVNRRVRGLLEVRKLSFASAEVTTDRTNMMIGGVTPFGVPPDLTIYVDAGVMNLESVIVGGGDRATKILVDPEVFSRMPMVTVVEDLANPFPPADADAI